MMDDLSILLFLNVSPMSKRESPEMRMRLTVTSELKARNYFNGPEFKYVSIKDAPTVRLALATRNERLCPQQKEFISHAQKWYQKKKEQIL